jgi:hypothetical protein
LFIEEKEKIQELSEQGGLSQEQAEMLKNEYNDKIDNVLIAGPQCPPEKAEGIQVGKERGKKVFAEYVQSFVSYAQNFAEQQEEQQNDGVA